MRAGSDPFDLGHEPPLSVDGDSEGLVDRRRISVQWFAGTILTGLCGAALMGGAVFASLDGETNFATVPERVGTALRGAFSFSDDQTVARKADRLPPPSESSVGRQIVRISTMTRVGQREVVRVRPFVRIGGNLSMTVSDISASIPPFNPQRMMADSSTGDAVETPSDAAADAAPDAEVSFVTRDLAGVLPKARIAARLPFDDVIMEVRDTAHWTGNAPTAVAGLPSDYKLAYAAEGLPDPYAGFEARVVPENITLLPKTTAKTNGGNGWNERTVVAKKGESVGSILKDLNATPEEIEAITALLGPRGGPHGLKEGQRLRILLSGAKPPMRAQPLRVIVLGDSAVEAVVALADTGKYVAVDTSAVDTEVAENEQPEVDDESGVSLYRSIYETALRNQVPRPVIDDMIRIYSFATDFDRKVQPGDSFEVLFAGEDDTPGDTRNDVLFTSLTTEGETKRFYRFQTPDDNIVDYYDEHGKSAKKFLVRKPVVKGIMRSPFGYRKHPILGISKLHTGVDWAAPHGTPIFAAGNGVVEQAGWEGGYGKFVQIQHNNGYETAYGHMTAFAKGIKAGTRVHQGQVIGFVGSTGLSTGAHVHFEIRINGRFVDPMRVKLPRGRELKGTILASFEKERKRLDSMMKLPGTPARFAQSNTGGAGR